MELELGPPRRLHSRGPASRGVPVDREGLALGPDGVLVRKRPTHYKAGALGDIRTLLNGAFDYRGDEAPLHRKCAAIAKALGDGDLLKAQLLGLLLPIGE